MTVRIPDRVMVDVQSVKNSAGCMSPIANRCATTLPMTGEPNSLCRRCQGRHRTERFHQFPSPIVQGSSPVSTADIVLPPHRSCLDRLICNYNFCYTTYIVCTL